MKKLFWVTTALVTLGGISVAAADVSISGNSRFRYEAWSDDVASTGEANNSKFAEIMQLWVTADMVADSGLEYGAALRFRKADDGTDRNYVYLRDDWGQLNLGKDFSPAYKMSLGADWRGTGVGQFNSADKGDTKALTGSGGAWDKTVKVAYTTPNINGLKVGLSFADAGAESNADATTYAINYTTSVMGDASLRLGYNSGTKDKSGSNAKNTLNKIGAEISSGALTASFVKLENKIGSQKKSANEVEVAYSLDDGPVLNVIMFNSKVDSGANSGDKYKATQVGASYDVAPGLVIGIAHTRFDGDSVAGADSDGGATRFQVRVNF